MNFKRLLLCGLAVSAVSFTATSAEAKEILSIYEINNFISKYTNAMNNPDPSVGRYFLSRHVKDDAIVHNTVNRAWVHPNLAHSAWYNYDGTAYYRYPYAYNPHFKPTSIKSLNKREFIAEFDAKKNMIPRYHKQVNILGTSMPADASSAVLDVEIKEYGFGYAHPYAAHMPYYGHNVVHSVARCQLHLDKRRTQLRFERISCNTNSNYL